MCAVLQVPSYNGGTTTGSYVVRHNDPIMPWQEVRVRPIMGSDPDEPVVTLQRDNAGVWWHLVGGLVVRRAETMERALRISPQVWRQLGYPLSPGRQAGFWSQLWWSSHLLQYVRSAVVVQLEDGEVVAVVHEHDLVDCRSRVLRVLATGQCVRAELLQAVRDRIALYAACGGPPIDPETTEYHSHPALDRAVTK